MEILNKGAEAIIYLDKSKHAVVKQRVKKGYRLDVVDATIRKQRTRREAKLLDKLPGIAPKVLAVDENEKTITMEHIKGNLVRDYLDGLTKDKRHMLLEAIGNHVGKMHVLNIIHGDLTTSNIIFDELSTVRLIDFGLGFVSTKVEDKAVDLHLFKHALESKHYQHAEELFASFLEGYQQGNNGHATVLTRLEKVEQRGRYKRKLIG